MTDKIDVSTKHWDRLFAPSSCLAMITTVDGAGVVNAASYGTCVRVAHEPVHVAFTTSPGKDTYNNILLNGEFVINLAPFDPVVLGQVRVVGLPFAPGVDELAKAGLTALASRVLRPPRIAECPRHFECRVVWTREWIDRVMIVGEVVAASVDADAVHPNGNVIWDKVRPAHYCGAPYNNQFVAAFQTFSADMPYDGPEVQKFEDDRIAMLKE